jgi:hypothetical protein
MTGRVTNTPIFFYRLRALITVVKSLVITAPVSIADDEKNVLSDIFPDNGSRDAHARHFRFLRLHGGHLDDVTVDDLRKTFYARNLQL